MRIRTEHSAWIAPHQFKNLTDRVDTIEGVINQLNKEKYSTRIALIKSAINDLKAVNALVMKSGPFKVDAFGKPIIDRNAQLVFIDALDDPIISQIFNSIKTQASLILTCSKNTFEKGSANEILVTSLILLCDTMFDTCHRKNKQEMTLHFFAQFYQKHSTKESVSIETQTTPVMTNVLESDLPDSKNSPRPQKPLAHEQTLLELRQHYEILMTLVNNPPSKTARWRYALALSGTVIGAIGIAKVLSSTNSTTTLSRSSSLRAMSALGLTVSGTFLLGNLQYIRTAFNKDHRSQLEYKRAIETAHHNYLLHQPPTLKGSEDLKTEGATPSLHIRK